MFIGLGLRHTGREIHRSVAQLGTFFYLHLIGLDNRGMLKTVYAVGHIKSGSKAGGIYPDILYTASKRIQHKGSSAVGHIQVYLELLVFPFLHVHQGTGRKDTLPMRREGIGHLLLEMTACTGVVIFQREGAVILQVGQSQMPVLVNRNVKGIAGLAGIHDVTLMMQANLFSLNIVERQVYVVGAAGENVAKVRLQGRCHGNIGIQTEFRLQLGGNVGLQQEFVLQLVFCFTDNQVLIHQAAGPEGRQRRD